MYHSSVHYGFDLSRTLVERAASPCWCCRRTILPNRIIIPFSLWSPQGFIVYLVSYYYSIPSINTINTMTTMTTMVSPWYPVHQGSTQKRESGATLLKWSKRKNSRSVVIFVRLETTAFFFFRFFKVFFNMLLVTPPLSSVVRRWPAPQGKSVGSIYFLCSPGYAVSTFTTKK